MSCSEVVSNIKLKLNGVSTLQEKQYLAKQQTSKVGKLENDQSFYSIADFLDHFPTLSERKVSLQEDKNRMFRRAGSE